MAVLTAGSYVVTRTMFTYCIDPGNAFTTPGQHRFYYVITACLKRQNYSSAKLNWKAQQFPITKRSCTGRHCTSFSILGVR